MAPRRRKIVRRRRPVEVVEDVEKLELEELEDEVEEEEEEELPPRTSKNVRNVRKPRSIVDDDEEEDEMEEEEEELPPRTRSRTRKSVRTSQAVKGDDDDEEEEVKEKKSPLKLEKVSKTMHDSILSDLLDVLNDGGSLIIHKSKDTYTISSADGIVRTRKLKGSEYWDEVSDPAYRKWGEEWRQKTYEEKVKFARKNKLVWNEHDNPRVDVIRLTEAVREYLGIEKYKEQYRTRASRAAIRA